MRLIRFFGMCMASAVLLMACEKENKKENNSYEPENYPTEDAFEVRISRPAYVFPDSYTSEGKALVDRVANPVDLKDEKLEVLILSAKHNITQEEAEIMLGLLANDGTLVFVEPQLPQLDAFCRTISSVARVADWGDYYYSDAVQRILEWADASPFEGLVIGDEKDQYEIVGIRAKTLFLSQNPRENTTVREKVVYYCNIADEGEEPNIQTSPEFDMEFDFAGTDYFFGMKADEVASWINSQEPSLEEEETEKASVAALMATKAGGDALENLVKSQRIILSTSNVIKFHFEIVHPVKIQYDVWAAYSEDKKLDYYCVKQSVTLLNQDLNCGPGSKDKWRNGSGWSMWKALEKKVDDDSHWYYPKSLCADVMGPYLQFFELEVSLENASPNVDKYYPMNNTAGGINQTESFSFNLNGNIGVSGGRPAGGVGAGWTWGSSVSKFNPDLSMTAALTNGGLLKWSYSAPRMQAYYKWFSPNEHDIPRAIQTTTCTVEHAWVWSVASEANTINLKTHIRLSDEWLSYDDHRSMCTEYYIPCWLDQTFKSVVNCPPRKTQEWTMTVSPANMQVEAYLKEHLKDYFIPNFKLFTRKAEHKASDTADEISVFVKKSQEVFNKNATVMKQAAEYGKVSEYTIRWHNLNVAGTEDDFTYTVK